MLVVKVLEKKIVIQMFGLMLFLSPLMNMFLTMSIQPVEEKWTMVQFWKVVNASALPNNVLFAASFVIGLVMLSGSKKAWKWVLVLLGGYIALQLTRLGKDIRANKIYGLVFLINVSAFFFIADQLAFKQKLKKPEPQPTTPNPAPPVAIIEKKPSSPKIVTKKSSRKILVAFENQKPWGELVQLSAKGIQIREHSEPPPGIETRVIEVTFGNSKMSARMTRKLDNLFFFEFENLQSQQVQKINDWLYQQAG